MLLYILLLSFVLSMKVEDKYMPYVGNGYVSMKINDPGIFIAGIFNGKGLDLSKVSHRATLPNYLQSVTFKSGTKDLTYDLDVENGVFYRNSVLESSTPQRRRSKDTDSEKIKESFYAHRSIPNLLVYEISSTSKLSTPECFEIKNMSGTSDLKINVLNTFGNLTLYEAETIIEETNWTGLQSFTFIKPSQTEFCSDFETPFRYMILFDDDNTFTYDKYLDDAKLFDTHSKAWKDIWRSKISVEGNEELNTIIQNSIYYILSSLQPNGNFSVSPGSLSSNSYNGHTFWDAETWMYPTLVPLYPKFARSCLNYRLRRRKGASIKAKLNGFEGYMFPWESAVSGTEVCPLSAPTGKLEQHISSDIVLAFKNYYHMYSKTLSEDELNDFLDLVSGVADFWISRVTVRPSNTSAFDIIMVIPPDEYHEGDNSVFTNAGAQISLNFATQLAKELSQPSKINPRWDYVASRLYFPKKEIDGQIIDWEFEEYKGDTIKQADVVLLSYPLNWKPAYTRNDLLYYEKKVDKNGPCMTYGIHSIEWLLLGNETAAYSNFLTSFQENVQKPFYVWTEVRGGSGAVNFITGAGNFLQGVVFGYGGMRIISDGYLRFRPYLIPNTKSLKFENMHLQDSKFSMLIQHNNTFSFICEEGKFILELTKTKQKFQFQKGVKKEFDNQEFTISIN